MTNLDPAAVKLQISNLRLQFPEMEEDEADWLLSLESQTDANELLSAIVDRIHDREAMSAGCETKIAEMQIRADRFAAEQKKLRAMALAVLQMAGLRKKELPTATLSVRKGGYKLVIPDASAVPDEYCRIKKEPDTAAIKDGIASGAIAPNWAAIEQSPETIAIRTK